VGSSSLDMLGSIAGSRLVDMVLEVAATILVGQVDQEHQVVQELREDQEGHLDQRDLDLQGLQVGQLDQVVVEVVLHSKLVNKQGHKR